MNDRIKGVGLGFEDSGSGNAADKNLILAEVAKMKKKSRMPLDDKNVKKQSI